MRASCEGLNGESSCGYLKVKGVFEMKAAAKEYYILEVESVCVKGSWLKKI